jgi:hypothetical protein
MSETQSEMTDSSKLTGDFLARSSKGVNISCVMGLHCQATFSSLSPARIIFEDMLAWSGKSAGMTKWQKQNKTFVASTYLQIVAEQELWSNMSCLMKQAIILSKPGLLPQGSGIWFLLMKFT